MATSFNCAPTSCFVTTDRTQSLRKATCRVHSKSNLMFKSVYRDNCKPYWHSRTRTDILRILTAVFPLNYIPTWGSYPLHAYFSGTNSRVLRLFIQQKPRDNSVAACHVLTVQSQCHWQGFAPYMTESKNVWDNPERISLIFKRLPIPPQWLSPTE